MFSRGRVHASLVSMEYWQAFPHPDPVQQPGSIFGSPLPAPIPEECLFCESFPDTWACCAEIQDGHETKASGTVFGVFHGMLARATLHQPRVTHTHLRTLFFGCF